MPLVFVRVHLPTFPPLSWVCAEMCFRVSTTVPTCCIFVSSCITDALLNPLNGKYVKLPHYSTKIHEAANHSLMEGNEDKTALKIPLGNRIVLIC